MREIIGFLILFLLIGVFIYIGRSKLAVLHYNRGCRYYDSSRYNEAISAFKESLAIDPSAPFVHYQLAQAYIALSEIYLKKEMYDEVLATLRKVQLISPSDQAVQKMVGTVSLDATVACIEKGTDAFLAGDRNKAYDLVNKALLFKPDFPFAQYTLAFFDYSLRKDEEAEERLKGILRLNAKYLPVYHLLGMIYLRKNQYEEAVKTYEEGLRIEDKDVSLNNELGLALNRLERYDDSARYLETAVSFDPTNLGIRYSLASNYRDKGNYEVAIAEYEKILRVKPDYPHIHNDLGGIYRQQGRNNEAQQAYQKEISFVRQRILSNPKDVIALNDLANALNNVGDYAQAKQLIEQALGLDPGYAEAYFTSAQIYENLRNYKEAMKALKKAGELFGDAAFIRKAISRVEKEGRSFQNRDIKDFSPLVVVHLKNGRQMKGRIRKEDDAKMILEVALEDAVGTVTLYRDAIDRVDRGALSAP